MTEPPTKYPYVRCSEHAGDPLPGYIVCGHLIARGRAASADDYVEPTNSTMGVRACASCAAAGVLDDDARAVCAHRVREWWPAPGQCDCADWTHVGHPFTAYWPDGNDGQPTGHHPECRHYRRPPVAKALS